MNQPMASPHPSWETALERFRSWREKQNLQDRTRREELRLLEKLRAFRPEPMRPHELSEGDVLDFFRALREVGATTKTQAHYATAMRTFLRYLGAAAAASVPAFPQTASGQEGRYLTDGERSSLWTRGCVTPEDELLLALGLGAGWRRSDSLGALLTDFLPSIEMPERAVVHGKGEKYAPRVLELHPVLREKVPRFLIYRTALVSKALDRMPSEVDPGTLFVAVSWRDGLRPMGKTTFENRLNEIYRRAGVDPGGWPSHNLRRTWADNRLEALTQFYGTKASSPALALEMAIRQVCFEGRWKDEKTLRQSYFKRREAPTAEAWALTKV